MVKIGFISEGKSDRTVLNSERFKKYLLYKFEICFSEEDIRYGGGKTGIKTNFNEIINYRDNKHYYKENHIFVVMTREMEAWFLADSELKFDCLGKDPEEIYNPSDVIAQQLGVSSHGLIAHRLKDRFSLERAAENAPSAKRFLSKLQSISQIK